jgi:hypothetical protein
MGRAIGAKAWSQEDIATLRKMWNEGHSSHAIADAVNRNSSTIRQYVTKNRDWLGLEPRTRYGVLPYKNTSEFDKQWYGSVPFGHWTITKPWRTT